MGYLNDGFSTKIAFGNGAVHLHMKEVTPPGYDAGGEIDTTTMFNTKWRTRYPKQLITLSNASFNSAYDDVIYTDLLTNQLGVNQLITVTFPDTHTLAFWGWLNKFTPSALKEGEQPMAECEIIPSNRDNSGNEQAPVYT